MTDFTHSLALLIGIDAYANGIPRLTTAVNDATRLAGLLRDAHGYETVLLTEPADGQPVTRARLAALFTEELPARLGEDDRLLVYFAGHGVALDGDDGPRGYLVPQDARPGDSASMLAMTDLHAWLTALPCRHMLAILDCCFAGAFRWASTRHIGALPDVIYRERYDRYLRSPAWQVLTSAAYDQKALDVLAGDAKRGALTVDSRLHSPFALALFEALANGEADLAIKGKRDGVITATELYHYLREQVEVQAEKQASHEQTPGLWPLNKHRKGEFIFLAPGHPLNLPPAPDLTTELNPYRGLKSYDQQHASLFFGREDEIKELVALVEQRPFLAVLGASGTGKSSLVKAGVLPRLQGMGGGGQGSGVRVQGLGLGGQGAGGGYHVLSPMRPTDQPVRALEALLRAELGEDPSGFPNPKGLGDDALAAAITRWAAAHPGQCLVLTIDQFEELATLCRDDAERERFLRLLAAAVEQQAVAFRLIITLRTDFEPQFTQDGSPLANLWQSARLAEPPARYIVPPMDIEDLRQVIEGPAAVRVLYFDPPELVDDLIKEVIQTPGALPLLSFTLSELYVKYVQSGRDDRALSGVDYQALGGVIGSLRNRATEEYDRLPDDAHRATMQRVMLRMVATEGGDLARRRVALSELEYPTAEENARVQTVLDRLVNARLLVRDSDNLDSDGNPDPYVEPAHDALVLAWDKLLRWKKEAEEVLPLQRRLWQSAREWQDAPPDEKPGLLWDDDPRLPQVEETLWPTNGEQKGLRGRLRWARQVLMPKTDVPADTKWLNGAELTFVQTSVQRRAAALKRILGIGLAVIIVVGALVSFGLYTQRQSTINAQTAATEKGLKEEAQVARATEVAAQAETERLKRGIQADQLTASGLKLLEEDPPQALLLAVEGLRVHNDVTKTVTIRSRALITATDFVTTTITRPEMPPNSALTNIHKLVEQIHGIPLIGHQAEVQDVAFSPDGNWLATASGDHTVRLWNMGDKAASPIVLKDHQDVVGAVEFSPDGTRLASASADQTVRLWNLDDLSAKPTVFADASRVMAFSPDGNWLAAASLTGEIRLWEVDNPERVPIILEGHTDEVRALAFSPNGHWLASGSNDLTARVWSISDPIATPTVLEHAKDVLTLAFSLDSHWLATGSLDDTARVWNTSDFTTGPLLLQHDENIVAALAFSPNSRWLATGTWSELSGMVRVWNLEVPQSDPVQFPDHGYRVNSLAFSLDGHWLAGGSHDADGAKTVRLWDLSVRATNPTLLVGQEYAVFALAFSPDARWLATGSADAKVVLWDLQSTIEPKVLRGHIWTVTDLAFSRDGRWLASVSFDGGAFLWNLENGEGASLTLLENKDISHVSFTPDGRWLLTALTTPQEEAIRVWDLASDSPRPFTLKSGDGPVVALTSSEDASWIAASFADSSVRLWPSSSLQSQPIFLNGHNGPVQAIAFSSDGRWLATGSVDKTIYLWDVAKLDRLPLVISGHKDSIASVAFSVDGRWLASRSSDNVLLIWDVTDPSTAIIEQRNVEADGLFSPDGRWLAFRSSDNILRIWDVTDPSTAIIEQSNVEEDGFFSPDGHWFLAVIARETARVWNLTAPGIPAVDLPEVSNVGPFSPDGRWVLLQKSDYQSRQLLDMTEVDAQPIDLFYALGDEHWQFSSDSQWLAGAVGDLTRIWDVTNPESYPIEIRGQYEGITSLSFSVDGRRLATGAGDGNIRIYTWQVKDLIDLSCRLAGENFSQQEWKVWFGPPYRPTCPQWTLRATS